MSENESQPGDVSSRSPVPEAGSGQHNPSDPAAKKQEMNESGKAIEKLGPGGAKPVALAIHEMTQFVDPDALVRTLEKSAEEILIRLRAPGEDSNSTEEILIKFRKKEEKERHWWGRFAALAKDLGPVITSLAAITVTIVVSYYTYQFNARQAEATSQDQARAWLTKRTWLDDFAENEETKRELTAIKLASYGVEAALPAVKDALSVANEPIRKGGVLTALTLYRSAPANHSRLLQAMLEYSEDSNSTLRLGVLEFYIEASKDLALDEKQKYLGHLEKRLGPNARLCAREEGGFVLNVATFLTKGPFPEAKDLLLNIAVNCPHEKTNSNYEGARIQAVNMLPIVAEDQELPESERAAIANKLRELITDDSDELNSMIEAAITRITHVSNP